MKKNITLLGATGSIGCSTVDVILQHPERFAAFALVAHRNVEKMLQLAEQLKPSYVVMTDEVCGASLQGKLPQGTQLLLGMDAAIAMAEHSEVAIVIAAMVGSVGLPAALAAVQAGKRVGLANKECLVTAGRLFMAAAKASNAELIPVDSEHAAVHQCLAGHGRDSVRRIILTASGGPFRQRDPETLHKVTPEEAIAHPNWSMGAKISVDSATMFNKALELIEARWLFDARADELSAIIHPQSIVHAMVEYQDGAVLAQLAMPDMRSPIVYALQEEPRLTSGIDWLELAMQSDLHFEAVNEQRFPVMRLVQDILRADDSAAIVFNAANEVANAGFRSHQLPFTAIIAVVEKVLGLLHAPQAETLDEVWAIDQEARVMAQEVVKQRSWMHA